MKPVVPHENMIVMTKSNFSIFVLSVSAVVLLLVIVILGLCFCQSAYCCRKEEFILDYSTPRIWGVPARGGAGFGGRRI